MLVTINSTTVDTATIEETLPSFKFTYNPEGLEKIVNDKDLNSEESALGYAKKEFLYSGTDNQTITFKTYARGLHLNSIITLSLPEYAIPIDLTKHRFIVTGVSTEVIGAKNVDMITGVRYD